MTTWLGRDRAGWDVQQVKWIKDPDGNVLTSVVRVLRWKQYFEELVNINNVRERRLEETEIVNQKTSAGRKWERPWEGGKAVTWVTRLFNKVLESERIAERRKVC